MVCAFPAAMVPLDRGGREAHGRFISYVFAGIAVNALCPRVVLWGKVTMKSSRIVRGRCLALVVLMLASSLPASAQGFKWWQDETFRRELGLTADQRNHLEEIF